MSVNRAKATKDEGVELGGTHAGLASTSLDDAVNEKVIHLEEDNAAIFFRTHLSDIKLLKDPAISAIRRNSIRSMISESELNSLNEDIFQRHFPKTFLPHGIFLVMVS